MKKNLLIYSSVVLFALILISGTLYNTGSPGAKTGSPLDKSTCVQCHTGSDVTTIDNWITSDIPETGWAPKTTYNITVTAVHETAGRIGFELTAENGTSKIGKFTVTDTQRTKYANNQKAVTHTTAGHEPTDGQNVWTVQWTSPDVDSGDITFYAAINAADGAGSTANDQIFTSSVTYAQDQGTTAVDDVAGIDFKVYPNPTSNYIFVESAKAIESFAVYNAHGQKLKDLRNLSGSTKVDVSDLSSGMYIVSVNTEEGSLTRKLQVKH